MRVLLQILVKNQVICPKCRGSGAKSENDVQQCHACQGRGVRVQVQQLAPGFVQQFQSQFVPSSCAVVYGTLLII